MDKHEVLKQYFGHSTFRQGQERLIDGILSGRDVLGVMPTGGGKSMCYQVPALLLPGLTLVVSPLISLMKDQVAALKEAGAPAAYINSSLTGEQLRTVYSRARQGAYKLIYIAPERLEGEGFAALAREADLSLVAVDEAHCISQWGQDFRPSYLRIREFVDSLPRRPMLAAFTATATGQVREDIVQRLGLRDPVREVTGFDRPNLFFDVRHPRNKMEELTRLLREREGRCGIIYCATRGGVDRVCRALEDKGVPAARYHAGMEDGERRASQDDFQFDRRPVMVATNAFGMGIDKSNVSFVIHYNMPKSLEAYYQEAGRAGRDGEPADCVLLYSAGDVTTARFLIENGGEELSPEDRAEVRRRDYERLNLMVDYCKTTGCLRGYILDYFGQEHGPDCGSCGNCVGEYTQEDVTVPAQMILSCVLRVREKLGYYVGKTLIVRALRGSRDQRVLELGLDGLSTYGLMSKLAASRIREIMDFLELEGFLRLNPAYSTLEPAGEARAVLFQGKRLYMSVRKDRAEERAKEKRRPPAPAGEAPEELTAALKAVRNRLAQREDVPAYIVFSNATLTDMAAKRPQSMESLLEVSGVGRVKAAKYGAAFLEAIAQFEAGKKL